MSPVTVWLWVVAGLSSLMRVNFVITRGGMHFFGILLCVGCVEDKAIFRSKLVREF